MTDSTPVKRYYAAIYELHDKALTDDFVEVTLRDDFDVLAAELAQMRAALADIVKTEEEYGDPANAAVNESWLKAKTLLDLVKP